MALESWALIDRVKENFVKRRTIPHVSVQGSYAEDDFVTVNREHTDPHFGLIRFRGDGWYQNRRCPNGLLFNIGHIGPLEHWQWTEWSKIEPRLDELIHLALFKPTPDPWENPDALDCDLMYFARFLLESPGKFELIFDGRYTIEYHESLLACFEDYELKSIEWIS
jgi:hypothetical protein